MSSGFISEGEAAEIRKRRQEEWEKVRKSSDPIERPEEPYDNRSLFERLQEQKQKKDLEYEEAHKLKNMIKGLDDDEIEFLDLVDQTKLAADRKKEIEEEMELSDYRNRVAILQEKTIDKRLQAVVTKPKVSSTNKLNQQTLLKGVIVKKTETSKRTMDCEKNGNGNGEGIGDRLNNQLNSKQPKMVIGIENKKSSMSAMKCVAVLPGLGNYNDSSSDENSSDSDNSEIESKSRTDLCGRKIEIVPKNTLQHAQSNK